MRTKAYLIPLVFHGTLVGVIPWWISEGFRLPNGPLGLAAIPGAVLVLAGIVLIFRVADLFVRFGRGTPAPFDPPRKMVLQGPFRRSRNPLYLGVFMIAFGEALATLSGALLLYATGLVIATHLHVMIFEEPALRRRFGDVYDVYRSKVPRWIPRFGRGAPDGSA